MSFIQLTAQIHLLWDASPFVRFGCTSCSCSHSFMIAWLKRTVNSSHLRSGHSYFTLNFLSFEVWNEESSRSWGWRGGLPFVLQVVSVHTISIPPNVASACEVTLTKTLPTFNQFVNCRITAWYISCHCTYPWFRGSPPPLKLWKGGQRHGGQEVRDQQARGCGGCGYNTSSTWACIWEERQFCCVVSLKNKIYHNNKQITSQPHIISPVYFTARQDEFDLADGAKANLWYKHYQASVCRLQKVGKAQIVLNGLNPTEVR